MALQAISIKCPNCGAPVTATTEKCEWCRKPVIITSFNIIADMDDTTVKKYAKSYREDLKEHPNDTLLNTSVAFCFLKLNMYDDAFNAFSKTFEDNFDNSEVFFYAAVSLLKGKKAFLHNRAEIDKILELVNAAVMIEKRGIYYYFLAYIKHDYFKRKFLKTTPTHLDYLKQANALGCSRTDIAHFYSVAGVEPVNMI